ENTVFVDSCLFDQAGQAAFRVSGGDEKLFITNSRFNRIGRPSNPDNGRFIDNRGDGLDSLVVRNCQITNITSRAFRTGSGADANYVEFSGNTFVNIGQHAFDFQELNTLVFVNNIVANPIFLGFGLEDQRLDDPEETRYVIELDTFLPGEMTVVVANNNIYLDPAVASALPVTEGDGDSITPINMPERFYHPAIRAAIDSSGEDTNISEVLSFEDGPIDPVQFLQANAADTTSGNEVPAAQPWDVSNLMESPLYSGTALGSTEPIARFSGFYDLCYGADAESATASRLGNSLGAFAEDCTGLTNIINYANNWNFSAFPNPTEGWINLQLADNEERMMVTVFSAAGQLVLRKEFFANQTVLDLSTQPAGTYFLQLRNQQGATAVRAIIKR
ncbi:MAG: T9SS type A sorting domain-containing protein, partial [Bacteroidota bacterium]